MPDAHANFAVSLVATAPSPATSGTSLVVTAGEGARFPAVPFNAVIFAAGSMPTPSNAEVVRVTARSTDTLTITRAQESSTARTVVVGDQIVAAITRKTLEDAEGVNPWAVRSATDAPQVVRQSAAGTTADIMDWQDQGGSVVSAVGPLGQFLEGGRRVGFLTSRLTTAGTVASATFTSSGLSVTLLANKVYRFRCAGIWRTSATASTCQHRMNFGGTVTGIQYTGKLWTATGVSPASVFWTAIANQGANAAATAAAATTDYPWEIEGLIRVGASGGSLVHEQARAAGAGTLTVGVDSWLEAREVA